MRAARGALIRAARVKLGMNQARFAEHVGTSQATVSRVEAGHVTPGDDLPWPDGVDALVAGAFAIAGTIGLPMEHVGARQAAALIVLTQAKRLP